MTFQQKLEKILREEKPGVLTEDQEHSPCAVKPEHGEEVTSSLDGTGKIDATRPVKHTGDSTLKTTPGVSASEGPTGHIPGNSDLPRGQKDGLGTNNGPGKNSLPPKPKVYGLREEEEEEESKKKLKEEKKELPPFMKKKGHKEPDGDEKKDVKEEEEESKKLKEEEEESKRLKEEEEEESKRLKEEEEEESKRLKEEESETIAAKTLKNKGRAGEKADKIKEETDQEEGPKDTAKLKEEEEDKKADKKLVKEATKALFEGETISEVLKEKTATIFEATLSQRIKEYRSILTERFTKKLNARVQTIREELTESVNGHLDLVVENWVKENEVPLEKAIKAELVEEFIGDLKICFENHYIDLPQEKVDVVTEMSNRIGQLETKLNEQITIGVNLQKQVKLYERSEVFDKVSKGLASTQVEKLRSLSENVEFKSAKQFEAAVKTLKENVDKTTAKTNDTPKKTLTEQTLDQNLEVTENSGMFDSVRESMARMAKS
jgi:hypothetical protein